MNDKELYEQLTESARERVKDIKTQLYKYAEIHSDIEILQKDLDRLADIYNYDTAKDAYLLTILTSNLSCLSSITEMLMGFLVKIGAFKEEEN